MYLSVWKIHQHPEKKKHKNPTLCIIIMVFTIWSEIVTLKYPTEKFFH